MTASERLKLREYLATEFEIDTSMPWLLCVAMMRLGAKRDPYRVLANAMADTTRQSFPLLIAGSGSVLSAVVEFFKGADSVRFAGECSPRKLREIYAAADLFVWPAAFLSWPAIPAGTATTVDDGKTSILTNTGDAHSFARAVDRLLQHRKIHSDMSGTAKYKMRHTHTSHVAEQKLRRILEGLRTGNAA